MYELHSKRKTKGLDHLLHAAIKGKPRDKSTVLKVLRRLPKGDAVHELRGGDSFQKLLADWKSTEQWANLVKHREIEGFQHLYEYKGDIFLWPTKISLLEDLKKLTGVYAESEYPIHGTSYVKLFQ